MRYACEIDVRRNSVLKSNIFANRPKLNSANRADLAFGKKSSVEVLPLYNSDHILYLNYMLRILSICRVILFRSPRGTPRFLTDSQLSEICAALI